MRCIPTTGRAGRPTTEDMMLALLFYAYMTGQRSSRRIEGFCRTDAAYRVICGGVIPDHSTIARFLVNHERAMSDIFVEVLRLCVAAGLVKVDLLAVDGTKMGADAALDQNRTARWIREEIASMLADARDTDQAEDQQPGLYATDELPEALSTPTGRLARLEQALALIEQQDAEAAQQAAERAAKARAEAAEGRRLPGRKPKDPQAALLRAEADETAVRTKARTRHAARHTPPTDADDDAKAAVEAAVEADPKVVKAVKATAKAREAAAKADRPATRANITDPESRIMSTANDSWLQGYNLQAVVNQAQIIIAMDVCQDANDLQQFQPMLALTHTMLHAAGVSDPIGRILADAGYCSEANLTAEGPDRLIATTSSHKQRKAAHDTDSDPDPPPPDDASHIRKMEHKLRTEQGAADYAKRSHIVEPIFAFKANHNYRSFRRRGLLAAHSESLLMGLTHNLGKIFRQN